MPDTSSKGLLKPFENENYDVAVVNANTQRINDFAMGAFSCTSTTRPTGSNRWPGLLIYEEDTGITRVWNGTVWRALLDAPRTVHVRRAAAQSVANNTWTTVSWQGGSVAGASSVQSNSVGNFEYLSISGGVFEALKSGLFSVNFSIGFNENLSAAAWAVSRLIIGAGTDTPAPGDTTGILRDVRIKPPGFAPCTLPTISCTFGLNLGQKFITSVYQTSGASASVGTAAEPYYLIGDVTYLGPGSG